MLKRSHLPNPARLAAALALALALLAGCSKSPQTANTDGRQILHFGNGTEPQDLDPQAVTGVPENKIVNAPLRRPRCRGPLRHRYHTGRRHHLVRLRRRPYLDF